jgi:hypothetical protein
MAKEKKLTLKEQLAIAEKNLKKCREHCHEWRERAIAREERIVERAVLVYQAGIAHVFAVKSFNMADYGREAKRLKQGAFSECENFALGLAAAGIPVASMHSNMAGDVINQKWSDELPEAPFFDKMRPVWHLVVKPY